jgi:hypothetical protein
VFFLLYWPRNGKSNLTFLLPFLSLRSHQAKEEKKKAPRQKWYRNRRVYMNLILGSSNILVHIFIIVGFLLYRTAAIRTGEAFASNPTESRQQLHSNLVLENKTMVATYVLVALLCAIIFQVRRATFVNWLFLRLVIFFFLHG